jgi:hypothetical protein
MERKVYAYRGCPSAKEKVACDPETAEKLHFVEKTSV